MDLMTLRNRYHVKASMGLTRADYLIINNYTRILLNISIHMLSVQSGIDPRPTARVSNALAN